MTEHRDGVVSASAQWLLTAFPPLPGAFARASARWQAREAASIAARLRYPTDVEDALLELCGPGGSARLDRLTGVDGSAEEEPWRSWVDEVVVSWAAALLGDPALAAEAAAAVGASPGGPVAGPSAGDLAAAPLLRHPDLLAPVAELHRDGLLTTLAGQPA